LIDAPRVGDLIAAALTHRSIATLLGMSRGRTYHEMIGADPQPARQSG
jgi:hypothetical protein